ncbi:MAG: hypothetical protein QOD96_7295 [Pseudonocardiales bacterium]|nr:hypothetical protein [Pseudonocardiales bacterium]
MPRVMPHGDQLTGLIMRPARRPPVDRRSSRPPAPCQKFPVGQQLTNQKEMDLSSTAALSVGEGELHLEVAIIPVSDVDRSKQFYERLGWRLDEDVAPMDGLRIVQFRPPGSGCSITFGIGVTTAAPGSAASTLTTSDIVSTNKERAIQRGVRG